MVDRLEVFFPKLICRERQPKYPQGNRKSMDDLCHILFSIPYPQKSELPRAEVMALVNISKDQRLALQKSSFCLTKYQYFGIGSAMSELSELTSTYASDIWQKVFQAPSDAYRLVESMRAENLCLQTEVGKDALYHIRRAAVDYFLYRIAKETPTIQASFQYNKAKNCRHVELKIDSIYLTASYVTSSSALPRHAIFRENLIRQNLLLPFNGDENDVKSGDAYFILTYGGEDNKLEFVSLKYPYADGGLTEIKLPANITTLSNINVAPVENTENDIPIEIKKEFQDFSVDYEKQG